MKTTFEEIYNTNSWNGIDSRSGPGSSKLAVAHIGVAIAKWIADTGVYSVLDIPCGEGMLTQYFSEVDEYIGIDVVQGAVSTANINCENPNARFECADARTDTLPYVDAVFTRDCMQHLPVKEGLQMLENLRRTNASWLLASHYEDGINEDPTSSWHAYHVNLRAEPFNLGDPVALLKDGWTEDGTFNDHTKFIGAWKL